MEAGPFRRLLRSTEEEEEKQERPTLPHQGKKTNLKPELLPFHEVSLTLTDHLELLKIHSAGVVFSFFREHKDKSAYIEE